MLISSEQRDLCADVAQRWSKLLAWYQDPANANKPAINKIRQNEGLFAKIRSAVECSVFTTDPTDVLVARQDLALLEDFAIKDGFGKPPTQDKRVNATSFASMGTADVLDKYVEKPVSGMPLLDYLTDPARTFPIFGNFDPTKKSPEAQYDKCVKVFGPAVCKVTVKGETPGIGDIPWWVWALGATGVAGFAALTYTSFKAAPYVLSVIPETAPVGAAWMQARAADAQQAESTRRAREAESVYRAQMSEVLPYYIDATGRRVAVRR